MIRNRFFIASIVAMTMTAAPGGLGQSASRPSIEASHSHAEGQRLLLRTLDAHGGIDTFREFGTFSYRTEGLPYSANAPLDFQHTADLRFRHHHMEGNGSAGAFTAGVDRHGGWATDLDTLGVPPAWVNHGNSYFAMMPFVFADPGITLQSVGQRTFADQIYDAVRVTYDRGVGDTHRDDYVLYLDPQTHRLRLIDFAVTYGPMLGDTPADQAPRRSLEFVSWQKADGLLVPRELRYAPWKRTDNGGERDGDAAEYHIQQPTFSSASPDPTLFTPPSEATRAD